MRTTTFPVSGLVHVEMTVHRDSRGFFTERFNRDRFRDLGLPIDFIQDNHSRSLPGVLRGLHYQNSPSQGIQMNQPKSINNNVKMATSSIGNTGAAR